MTTDEIELIKEELQYLCKIAQNDIDKLEEVARQEAENDIILNERGYFYPPTTSQSGVSSQESYILKSRCTIPLSMVCFSIIDFLGKLTCDKQNPSSDNSGEKDKFKNRAQCFFKKLAKSDDLNNDSTANLFQDSYRHSITHAYLPSAGNGNIAYSVSYTKSLEEYALFPEVSNEGKKEKILNVFRLVNATKVGIKSFCEKIQNQEGIVILNNYKNYKDKGL